MSTAICAGAPRLQKIKDETWTIAERSSPGLDRDRIFIDSVEYRAGGGRGARQKKASGKKKEASGKKKKHQ
jgi:hypothetical protein